ncbi:MAG: FecR family protein [Candidatus Daviesbacteria bacterium]|nr:FecR family protein [Candidatus Daviesbacteria bacterium]
MKKIILPILLILTAVLFLSPKVEAQTDNEPKEVTSCEELKELYSGKKCGKYIMASAWPSGSARPDPMEFWCFVEEPTYDPAEGDSHLATVIKRKRPPDYFMKLSEYDRCSEGTESPADNVKDKEPSGWELPGKAFGEPDFLEEFRKLLEVLLNPREVLEKARKQGVSQAKIEEMVTPELLARLPYITQADEQKVWDSLANFTSSAQNETIVVKGKIKVKSPSLDDFIQVAPERKPISVTYLDAVITGADPEPTQLGYPWGPDAGAVISLPQGTEVELGTNARSVKLNQGEIEVKIQNNNSQNPFKIHSGSLTVVAPRTHFWVSQNSDKNQTVIGVYRGEVQVTTQDGQTATVVPAGDKPGVVVISQKLSPVKLSVAGFVLIAIVGGIVLFLNKRSKRRK